MKKVGNIIWILLFIIAIAGIVCAIVFGTNVNLNKGYVQIDANAKMEFLTNSKNEVESFMPKNEVAKQLIAEEEFVDLNICDATEKFIDLCCVSGLINVNEKQNVVLLGINGGLAQKLNNDVYTTMNNYFINNKIFCLIVENDDILEKQKEAKEYGISANKLMLVKSAINNNEDLIKEFSKKSESELIEIIQNNQKKFLNSYKVSESDLINKTKLIDFNRVKFNNHKNLTESVSIRDFKEEYDKFYKENLTNFQKNFSQNKELWLQILTEL